jgi:uncharacterized protein
MKPSEQARLLRIFLGEGERFGHAPLYEAIVMKARELGFAGATVLRGAMGYGATSHLHTAKVLRLSIDLPIVIEIVDSRERMDRLVPEMEAMLGRCLVTVSDVTVLNWSEAKGT